MAPSLNDGVANVLKPQISYHVTNWQNDCKI